MISEKSVTIIDDCGSSPTVLEYSLEIVISDDALAAKEHLTHYDTDVPQISFRRK